jgi:UDP-N-acetylmuramate--alanine ligase
MVAEADESDGSFTKLPSTIAVVTNIDCEHLDHYGSFNFLREAFVAFIEQIPFYGFATLCIDDAEVRALIPKVSDRKIITYGVSLQADTRITNIETSPNGTYFNIIKSDRKSGIKHLIDKLYLPMVGRHNVLNSAAAISIALELGLPDEIIRKGLANFGGVKRRFTKTGAVDGITIIDDYAHHPAEITAVLDAARTVTSAGRVMAIFQPHRYSRLQDLFQSFFTCFNNADIIVVADIYAAGEAPIEGISQDSLVEGLRSHGNQIVIPLRNAGDLAALSDQYMTSGDLIIFLGAGNITVWANTLPTELAKLRGCEVQGGT